MIILESFLKEIGAKKILIGGGYLGKCVDNFYESIRKKFGYEDISLVPELLTISPHDMISSDLTLLTKTGRMNFKVVLKYINNNWKTLEMSGELPSATKFSLYNVYR